MHQGITHKEAVRLAKEKLGNATAQELADYIRESFGLTIKPPIVAVLLGTIHERAALDQSRQAAQEKIERWKAENPEEAEKLAAAARRRGRQTTRSQAAEKTMEALGPVLPDEQPDGPTIAGATPSEAAAGHILPPL